MTDDVLFRMDTAYTLSQYKSYNRTVQQENRVYANLYVPIVLYSMMGVFIFLLFGGWFIIPIFVALGLFNYWMSLRGIRASEMAQYQAEQLAGTISYEFKMDSLKVTTYNGTLENPYSAIVKVLENSNAFYIMFTNNSGLIVPKEDCPPGLADFIIDRLPIKRVKDVRV